MGHIQLGQMPRSAQWRRVVDLLSLPGADPSAVAFATERAAGKRLDSLHDDPSLGYCFWLLSRLASASRGPDFTATLRQLGLDARGSDSVFGFVSQVSDRVRDETSRFTQSGPFGDLAADALTRALAETLGTEGKSLFGSSVDDLERAIRKHATERRFAAIARRFFGDFLARTLRFYVDKELPLHVGRDGFATSGESAAFMRDLDRFARESAGVMETFAGEWWSKHHYESRGAIAHDEAQRFVAHALDKLREEIREVEA